MKIQGRLVLPVIIPEREMTVKLDFVARRISNISIMTTQLR
ncbi:MAG: hypothetical protein Q4C70_00575 [Planctomycetia bacterium]|nr:hypothetical protein [Planctomycetia bacterium]